LWGDTFFCQAGDFRRKITKWGIIKERIKSGKKRCEKRSKEKEVKNKRQRKPGQRKKVKKEGQK
jgi:hypothetical protein